MGKGNKQSNQPQQQVITQSNIPEYARPYFEKLMGTGQALLDRPYTKYDAPRIEGFTDQQKALQSQIAGMQTPGQFGAATDLASKAGLQALNAGNYQPGSFNAQQVNPGDISAQQIQAQQYNSPQMQGLADVQAQQVQAQQYTSPEMRAAQTNWQPNLNYYQMQAPDQFGGQQAAQYMSPFQQNVTDIQKREAIRDAKQGQLAQDLGAARQGTYGGSRQLLASMERERNLGQQLGDIQGRGSQAAYENAQAQFERDRAAGMTAGQANLQAKLGVQQLGTQSGLQAALANLDAESQSRVQNLAAQLQTQGLNADQAMRAALANQQTGLQASLANQQAGLTVGQQNLAAQLQTQGLNADQAMRAAMANQQSSLQASQANQQTGLQAALANQQQALEAQRLGEQSRQFGAQQGLAGAQAAGQMGQTLSNIGSAQLQGDISRFGLQQQTAAQQQALNQQLLDINYQDFLRQQDWLPNNLQNYSSLLRGVPVQMNTNTSTYAQQPGIGQQLLGTGLAAAGIYNTFRG